MGEGSCGLEQSKAVYYFGGMNMELNIPSEFLDRLDESWSAIREIAIKRGGGEFIVKHGEPINRDGELFLPIEISLKVMGKIK